MEHCAHADTKERAALFHQDHVAKQNREREVAVNFTVNFFKGK